jgi:hypothetical protein
MIDLIETIGPIVGIVAFLGLAVLAFLIFQQAREVRRLREWAGRAPERAAEAAEASLAAAEARGEAAEEAAAAEERRRPPSAWRDRVATAIGSSWRGINRGLPFDARYLVVPLAAIAVAAGVLTGGFGLGGGDGQGNRNGDGAGEGQQRPRVAVLNATQVEEPGGTVIQGVPGLADEVVERVVQPAAGFRPGRRDNAASGSEETLVMFERGARRDANRLANEIEPILGTAPVEPMTQEVRDRAGGAPLAIVVGQDDADF